MERKCGECSVCCYIGAVPELKKEPHHKCKYVKTDACGSCSIFNSKKLPDTCRNFMCSWKRGFGSETDRPDHNGVMFSINKIENQIYAVAIELTENAITTSGKDMAIQIASAQKLPMIVIKHGTIPPNDTGDYVIIHNTILHKCKNIIGDFIEHLNDEVVMFELVKKPLGTFTYKAS